MQLWPQFISGAYRARSPIAANEALVNAYVETIDAASEAKRAFLFGTPGRLPKVTAGTVICRGEWSQDGLTVAVIGGTVYTVNTTAWTVTACGTVANDGALVSMASNGRGGEQLGIVSAGRFYILNLSTLAIQAITLPLSNDAVVMAFMDGYFLLLERDTVRIWFSALENGTLWDALDFFARSQTSDNNVGMVVMHGRLWVFGSQTSERYYDSGDVDNPFVPYPGSILQEGATSWAAITVSGESVIWLSQDNQGRARIVGCGDGTNVQPISTPAIDYALNSYPRLTDVEVVAYEQEGHSFVAFTCPSAQPAGVTWCVDLREQQWHQRSGWDDDLGLEYRWGVRAIVQTDGGLLAGDYQSGVLSLLDPDTFTDNGATIQRRRRGPYPSSDNQWIFLDQIELGVQPGVGLVTGQGSDPEVLLRLSRDGGQTWTNALPTKLGKLGEYLTRVIWRRLGRVRADRLVVEISQTDPVRMAWGPGLWLTVTPGSGRL